MPGLLSKLIVLPLLLVAAPVAGAEEPKLGLPPASQPAPFAAPAPAAPLAVPAPPSEASALRAETSATLHRTAAQRQRDQLLAANFGSTDQLAVGGGFVSYGDGDRYGHFLGRYSHFFFDSVVHSIHFGGGGLLGDTLVEGYPSGGVLEWTPRSVRFYYGLVGLDLTLTEWVGVELEAVFGVTLEGVGGGGLGALRIGKRDGVRVRAGGWLRSYIGHEAFLALEVPLGQRLQLTPQVVIDNLPAGERLGFRALLRADLRLMRQLGLFLEGGGAARDARTGGFVGSLGLAAHL